MKYYHWIILIGIIVVISILIVLINKYYKSKYDYFYVSPISPLNSPQKSPVHWKGLCLFDIDGTLTTGVNNYESIDLCIKAGYAVGITTAGAMYTPDNLMSFEWMPQNLHVFMQNNTFNNVASGIITGKYDSSEYQDIRNKFQGQHVMWGLLKAKSLINTAKLYNITDYNKMILFDNDPLFLKGLQMYHPDLRGVCAGSPCGEPMTPKLIHDTLKNID